MGRERKESDRESRGRDREGRNGDEKGVQYVAVYLHRQTRLPGLPIFTCTTYNIRSSVGVQFNDT